jgi:hypothetical protein
MSAVAAAQWTHFLEQGSLFSPAGGVAQTGWSPWTNGANIGFPNASGNDFHACSLLWTVGSFYDSQGDDGPSDAASSPAGSIHFDLRTLTTPLGYLISLPFDPFKPTAQPAPSHTYDFFALDVRSEFVIRGLGPDRDADVGCAPSGLACGCATEDCPRLTALGGSHSYNSAAKTEFQCPGCGTYEEALRYGGCAYSPTNGAESSGDLFLTSLETQPPDPSSRGTVSTLRFY